MLPHVIMQNMVEFERRSAMPQTTFKTYENGSGSVLYISSDVPSPFHMDIRSFSNCTIIEIADHTSIQFQDMMFEKGSLVASELSILNKKDTQESETEKEPDPLPSDSPIKITRGKKADSFKYKIERIASDSQKGKSTQFIDLEIGKSGDVTLTRRDYEQQQKADFVFRTAENGGKFPIFAQVFTKIAAEIIKADKKEKKSN